MPVIVTLALCALFLFRLPAQASELVVLVGAATEMPMARFENFTLVEGIHKDVGAELARRLKLKPVYLSLPRKRLAAALEAGQGDILCAYMPEWLDGPFDWSLPFIPVVQVLVTDRRALQPRSMEDVADQPVGTVLGYKHPELDTVLGIRFKREDAATTEGTLRKLSAGRLRHALTSKASLEYRLKLGEPPLQLHPPLVVSSYLTQCAVARNGKAPIASVNRAIAAMQKDGTVAAILGRYQ